MKPEIVCPRCNYTNGAAAAACWLCGCPLGDSPRESQGGAPAILWLDGLESLGPPAKPPVRVGAATPGPSFVASSLLLLLLLAAAISGLALVSPGVAILAAIVALPVLLRTVVVVQIRKSHGLEVGWLKQAVLLATSFATAVLLLCVAGFAAVAAFCGAALGAAGFSFFPLGIVLLFPALFFMGLVATVPAMIWFTVRQRWRDDTRGP